MERKRWYGRMLVAVLAATMLAAPAAVAETLRIGGTGASLGLMRELGAAFTRQHPNVTIEVPPSLGSTGGIKALLAGAIRVAVSSRPLRQAEQQAGAVSILLGETPLVFITSRTEPGLSVTRAQVVACFSLRQHTWPDGTPLRIVLRPRSETDVHVLIAAFPELQAGLATAWATSELPIAFSDQDNLDRAETVHGSLAAAALSAVVTEHRKVTVLPLDGVMPSAASLEQGDYPLGRPFYLVTHAKSGPLAEAFVRFVRSATGRKTLRQAGVLPPRE